MRQLMRFFVLAPLLLSVFYFRLSTQVPGFRAPASTVQVEPIEIIDAQSDFSSRVYRFRRELRATMPDKKEVLNFDLRGTLALQPVGDWMQASFHLDAGTDHPALVSSVIFLFKLNRQGELSEIRSEGSEEEESILRDLVLIYAYHTTFDTAGHFEMRLSSTAQGFVKQKVRYRGELAKWVQIQKSEHQISSDFSEFKGVEVTQMQQVRTLSKYQLRHDPKLSVGPARVSLAHVEEMKEAPLIQNSRGSALARGSSKSWEQLKPKLLRVFALTSPARMALLHEFVSVAKRDANAVREMSEWMQSRRSAGLQGYQDFIFGVGVLTSAGTEESQKSVIDFYRAHPDAAILNAIATMNARAMPETVSFLRETAQSGVEGESTAALFALGATLRTSPEGAVDEASIDLILKQYQSAQSISQKMDVLDAMGNSGHERFFPVIREAIVSAQSSSEVVSKAVFALRLMKSTEARALLQQMTLDHRYDFARPVITDTLSYLDNGQEEAQR